MAYAASFVEFNAEEANGAIGTADATWPSPFPNSKIIVQKRRSAFVAAITPWNFPAGG